MRKSVGSFIALNRKAILFLGVVLGLVVLVVITTATPTPTPTPGTCTPSTTVTEGDLFPGGIGIFGVTSGPGSVTIDHVNAGIGMTSLTVVGVPVNAVVVIPPFAPGTTAPVVVTFTPINPGLAVDFTLRAAGGSMTPATPMAAFIRARCADTCTPSTTVTEGDLFPGGIVIFGVTSGPGSVTIDHVNAGIGLQSLTVIGVPVNVVVNIPPFTPGTTAPVAVTFFVPNPSQPVDFTLRAAGGSMTPATPMAAFIRARCATPCLSFAATLSGSQEVPANASTATGSGTVVLNAAETMITVNLTFSGLTGGNASAAHIHGPAPPGVAAPVLIPLTGFPAATSGSYANTFAITPTQVSQLRNGLLYLNIHNATFPSGEIRGQLSSTPIITCPGSITKFADSGQLGASINPGAPVISGGCGPVTITGVRSDGKALNALYPIGVTLITWTATDSSGTTASCSQSIAVMAPSGPSRRRPITIPEDEARLILTDFLITCVSAFW